jgi:hypothetical protein
MVQKYPLTKILVYSTLATFLIMFLFFYPFNDPVNKQTGMQLENESVDVELVKSFKHGEVLGEYHVFEDEMKLKTQGQGFYIFMSTCSHELLHRKYSRESFESEESDHEKMEGLFSNPRLFWNWNTACFQLLDDKTGF